MATTLYLERAWATLLRGIERLEAQERRVHTLRWRRLARHGGFSRDIYTQTLICVLLGTLITGVVLIAARLMMDWVGIS